MTRVKGHSCFEWGSERGLGELIHVWRGNAFKIDLPQGVYSKFFPFGVDPFSEGA